eukprot:4319415-Ditylum_brightwellii.AAC.1
MKSEQNVCDDDNKKDSVEDSADNCVDGDDKHLIHLTKLVDCYLKARSKQNMCIDDGKEEGVDNSVGFGDKHLTHLTQFENNVNLGGCDKHMPVSKNVILWLRGGGLKDDSDSSDNGQKDNDKK